MEEGEGTDSQLSEDILEEWTLRFPALKEYKNFGGAPLAGFVLGYNVTFTMVLHRGLSLDLIMISPLNPLSV